VTGGPVRGRTLLRWTALIGILAMLAYPVTYGAFVALTALLHLAVPARTASLVALPAAVALGLAVVVGVGRLLRRELGL
jgi:hypothetical protein